ncbi:sulfotransferase 1C2A [Trichonephila clavipes]|nr:sulfotransferase 1C2A [Trichonephila clavipes]
MFSPKCFKEALEYNPQPGDVFINIYPKCGSTWMQNVALYIFRKGKELGNPLESLQAAPFIDMLGIEGINRDLEYNDYFDHLLNWYPHRDDPNVFYTRFEDMKKDMTSVMLKLSKFLGKEYLDAI